MNSSLLLAPQISRGKALLSGIYSICYSLFFFILSPLKDDVFIMNLFPILS